MAEVVHAIDAQVVLLAGAKASVTLERLSTLLDRVQRQLDDRIPEYERQYERVYRDEAIRAYLVEPGHWTELGTDLGFNDREIDAVARTHAEQLRRLGKDSDREAEFETALEIREAVVLDYS